MKCSFPRCSKKATAKSEKTGKTFCEDHAFDYMIKPGEQFMPWIEIRKI
jgi:hypothetical protein